MTDFKIVNADKSNIEEIGFFCIKNKKHPGYIAKRSWLQQRFKEGLRIKLILTNAGRQIGFLEYIPGEYTWRIVNAAGYLVIHCIWLNSNQLSYKGLATTLLNECMTDAERNGKSGVAVVTSDGPWMADKRLFIKNGFVQTDKADPYFQLLVHRLNNDALPSFPQNWAARLKQYQDLQLLYSNQCPYIGKAVKELAPVAEKHAVKLNLVEFKSAAEAREKMVSPYGMFNLIHNGQLLADHPVSATRFKNILQKELKLKPVK